MEEADADGCDISHDVFSTQGQETCARAHARTYRNTYTQLERTRYIKGKASPGYRRHGEAPEERSEDSTSDLGLA